MTALSPDDLPGLVEAVAEAIHDVSYLGKQVPPATSAVLARAVWAAVVEHLGLVEETRTHCAISGPHPGACKAGTTIRRFVSRWTEVDHGSE